MGPIVSRGLPLAGLVLAAGLAASSIRERPADPPGLRADDGRRGTASHAPTAGFYSPPLPPPPAAPGVDPPEAGDPDPFHEFYFTRAIFSDWRGGGPFGYRGSWSTDYPDADEHFVSVARRLVKVDAYERPNAVSLADPDLRRFPFLYALEVGYMSLSEPEVRGLRDYLAAGGFLVIDDFWGTREWANFEHEISRVLPGRPIVDVPLDHTLFRIFYNIEEILQVPGIRNAYAVSRGFGATHERDGYVPHVRGIFDDDGRLMVVINWNTDLGDAWEHADDPWYPLRYSTFAFELGMNMLLYGMTH